MGSDHRQYRVQASPFLPGSVAAAKPAHVGMIEPHLIPTFVMDKRVEATIEIMRTSDRNCASVAEMARLVGLSPWHFTRVFKTETSKTPKRYLKEIRMQKAEELLSRTLLGLKEIVYAVGLNDRSHFSRDFKRRHGLTPKQFVTQRRSYCAVGSTATAPVANQATE